ncbi:Txe/YoeB family addiction module toxin [Leptolyngbya boryana CZ1]|uniref:Endoribonuclease YoeB n=1 Tax=Leptolyngbya boryana CZ1 TaxID=3060204 RepID=A0AA96WU11_LEPBY|nr:Txe/YoeB family addiction module toxin [Leptolyngbya boryana]WNZ44149.1 Txe/YoeB family addiction module toxin [Leptolyngbya boryana CZ1]
MSKKRSKKLSKSPESPSNESLEQLDRSSVFEPDFREDLRFWIESDRKVALRIMDLVEAVMRDPFDGIGKPEPLKYLAANTWSRRITDEHRLVYEVYRDRVKFLQARFHYSR